jgi:hypothetical protein
MADANKNRQEFMAQYGSSEHIDEALNNKKELSIRFAAVLNHIIFKTTIQSTPLNKSI